MPGQGGLPALEELALILHLIGLAALREIGTVGRALKMGDDRKRRVVDLLADAADLEREVGILAVGGA